MKAFSNIKKNTTHNHRLFAFALQVKKARGNGMWYAGESFHKFVKGNLGLRGSYSTMKKYWEELEAIGAVKPMGTHKQLISRDDLAKLLSINVEGRYINQILRAQNIADMTLVNAANWVAAVLTLYDLRGQKFKLRDLIQLLDTAQYIVSGTSNKHQANYKRIKKFAKEASKKGLSTYDYAKSLLTKYGDVYVKTGSYHLSNKLGISQKRANKILNTLVKSKMIQREVIKVKHDLPVNYHTAEYLKEKYPNSVVIPTKQDFFIQVLGSKITLPDNKELFFKDSDQINRFIVKMEGYKYGMLINKSKMKTIKYDIAA